MKKSILLFFAFIQLMVLNAHKYRDIDKLATKTDLYHKFPFSFDEIIVKGGDFFVTSKGNFWYIAPGSINSNSGWYSIGMFPNGTVFHRCFTSYYPIVH